MAYLIKHIVVVKQQFEGRVILKLDKLLFLEPTQPKPKNGDSRKIIVPINAISINKKDTILASTSLFNDNISFTYITKEIKETLASELITDSHNDRLAAIVPNEGSTSTTKLDITFDNIISIDITKDEPNNFESFLDFEKPRKPTSRHDCDDEDDDEDDD